MERNWSELALLALLAVLHRLSALLDLFAFAGVCRSWRSVFKSSAAGDYAASRPPLILFPVLPDNRSTEPLRCRLLTLDDRSSHESLLSAQTLRDNCLGCSHGHLILLRRRRRRRRRELLLADALTGAETRLPDLPTDRFPYYYAVLTSPPSSPDSILLLFYSKYALLCLRLSIGEWSKHRLGPGVSFVVRVLSFKGRVYAVNDQAKLLTFDFSPELNVRPLEVGRAHPMPVFDRWHFGPQLVESSGELLSLLFVLDGRRMTGIVVYRMDFGTMMWVAMESLGDHALFIDCWGRCPVSCINPGSWGGRANYIYLAGPQLGSWIEFPFDGKTISDYSHRPLFPSQLSMTQWPSPIWLYPSMFY